MRQRGGDDSESSDNSEHERRIAETVSELTLTFGRPKARKRGGVRHKKSSTPKKKAKKKKVCRCGKSHKAVGPGGLRWLSGTLLSFIVNLIP